MRIVHFAPFAPCACGLYEAARDMVIADSMAGHEAHFVDVGITTQIKGEFKQEPGVPGKEDFRCGKKLITEDPIIAHTADIIVAHTGVPDNWISSCQAPIVWILHGRPTACFKPEQFGTGNSYSLIATLAQWPRIKAMVTFWDHHVLYWEPIIPKDKLVCFPAPPIDENRFNPIGKKHDFKELGKEWNIVLTDSWRDDVDIYEIIHGAIEVAKTRNDVRFHIYGIDNKLPACWEYLIAQLRKYDALGELWARRQDIEEVYRAADILLSPHRIVTRAIGEALSCGTPVIAADGCDLATFTTRPDEPDDVALDIHDLINGITYDPMRIKEKVSNSAKALSLEEYSKNMNNVYNRIR